MMQPANWWPLLGGLILIAVLQYFGFQAVDAAGLQPQTGTAIVLGKEHKPPGKSYRTDIVGGQTRVIPQRGPQESAGDLAALIPTSDRPPPVVTKCS